MGEGRSSDKPSRGDGCEFLLILVWYQFRLGLFCFSFSLPSGREKDGLAKVRKKKGAKWDRGFERGKERCCCCLLCDEEKVQWGCGVDGWFSFGVFFLW